MSYETDAVAEVGQALTRLERASAQVARALRERDWVVAAEAAATGLLCCLDIHSSATAAGYLARIVARATARAPKGPAA